jgi:eukaryotic-like serine/threonine-protein kinase
VAAVVHGALKLDAGERFPTAAAMLDAIRPLLSDGWALRDELLVPVSAATSGAIASKFTLAPAGDDARQRLVRIAVQGQDVDGSEPTEELDSPRRSAARGAETMAKASVTTKSRDGETPPRANDTSGPRSRARWAAPTAAGLMVAVGFLAFGLSRASSSKESAPERGPSTSAVETAAPAPAAPLPALKQGKLAVLPADAAVEIDGKPAMVEGGEVTIEGPLGSRHHVRLVKGQSELTGEVIMTDTGASPATMQLDTANPRPAAPPGASAMGATARPRAPKAAPSDDPLIPEKFK